MSTDRFAPQPGQRWTGSDEGRWESAHEPGDDGTCNHWDGRASAYCLAEEGTRLFAQGVRCPLHTPARMRGVPEPDAIRDQAAGLTATARSFPDDGLEAAA